MKIHIAESYEKLSQLGANLVVEELRKNKRLLLCAATGGSPTGTYQLLGKEYQKTPALFSETRVIKLDEWGGIPMDNAATCETYIQQHLIRPLHISDHRYFGFHSNPAVPESECTRVQGLLLKEGPIDLCILGLGINGHLAFNEPAEYLQSECHIAQLSAVSQQHAMASNMIKKPAFGFTLGMGDILMSKKIVILVSGDNKELIASSFLSKKISTQLPASFLWLHPDVTCIIQKSLLKI
jgi:galactosamine-6-phosphate isomerase